MAPAYGGYGVARTQDGTLFVRGAYPGERVRARVLRKKGAVLFGRVEGVLRPSSGRAKPACRHFGVCGGCHLQDISTEAQIALKRTVLADVLRRVGGISGTEISVLSGEAWGYRHRVDLQVASSGAPGFFRERSHDVVEIEECPVLLNALETLLVRLREFPEWLRSIRALRIVGDGTAGEGMLRVLSARGSRTVAAPPSSLERHLGGWRGPGGRRGGAGRLSLDLGDLRFFVNAGTFFQAHWQLNTRLAELVFRWLEGSRSVADIYGGAGNLSLLAAHRRGSRVVVFEGEPSAVRLGQETVRENGLAGVRFIRGNVRKTWPAWRESADAVILDPPRAGTSRDVLATLVQRRPRTVIYVSCDPATLARDLKELVPSYGIREIHLVDFFPQTYHIETAVLLEPDDGR